MASTSVHQDSSSHAHPTTRRPRMVKVRHTWHGEIPSRSHFEDFMREIGVDAQATHLCCIPRQVPRNYIRVRSKSEPAPVAAAQDGSGVASHTVPDRGRSVHERNIRRQSFPTTTALKRLFSPPPAVTRPALPSRTISVVSSRGNEDSGRIPAVPLKTPPLLSTYTQNHGASYICTTVSADQALRNTMRATVVGELSRRSSHQAPNAGQDHWEPLPQRPALVPAKSSVNSAITTPKRSVSRVPSFASLETVSSSEGPETPRGQYSLLPSPSQAMSPTLSELETTSRIRVPGQCVTCKRTGHNFPSCPACGDMWCSRECRVQATRGTNKHGCLAGGRKNALTSGVLPAAPLTGYAS